jgi:hypothetical protein
MLSLRAASVIDFAWADYIRADRINSRRSRWEIVPNLSQAERREANPSFQRAEEEKLSLDDLSNVCCLDSKIVLRLYIHGVFVRSAQTLRRLWR